MKVVYCSMTGNVRAFVRKLNQINKSIETIEIRNGKEVVDDKYLLITHTTGKGEMPKKLVDFLGDKTNVKNAVGVVGSGNKNWGAHFCGGAYKASEICGVPVLHTFEVRGNQKDIDKALEIIMMLEEQEGE